MKEKIRDYALSIGADVVGFASAKDYDSPNSPSLESVFPEVKSIVMMGFAELDNCESDSPQIAYGGRSDLMEFVRSCDYKLARYLKKEVKAKSMTVPLSYPLHMSYETKGSIGDVSLRHAAVAAGLGSLGRHNLVINPELGSRIILSAVLTDIELTSDPAIEDLCTDCNLCVESCPGGALDNEGKTHLKKCIMNSQPYGIASSIGFWHKFIDSSPDEQKKLFTDPHYWRLYQANFIGFQYFCFNCIKTCPL